MRTACGAVIVLLAFAIGACGESSADKAQTAVCDARADMSKQVDELKAMTPATVTTDAVKENLTAIRNDLKDITAAQSDLSDDRRSEAEAANKTFSSSVRSIVGELGTSLSASDAKSALTAALQQLATTYQSTFAPLNCD
jgi:hypothetical protein